MSKGVEAINKSIKKLQRSQDATSEEVGNLRHEVEHQRSIQLRTTREHDLANRIRDQQGYLNSLQLRLLALPAKDRKSEDNQRMIEEAKVKLDHLQEQEKALSQAGLLLIEDIPGKRASPSQIDEDRTNERRRTPLCHI
ncbi:hypothetical protein SIIN_2926_T [Serendipita indica DSM 11827]|nr:hypothetical protein SIIN_2926_T [Serendipita indica DSM 11827]